MKSISDFGQMLDKAQMKKISGGTSPRTERLVPCSCIGINGTIWCPSDDICDCIAVNCGAGASYLCTF